ncbi:MAG TPA: glycine zipper family protein [Elusimicrobiota bacterium]|jgi:uncharacterized protein YcfJ|nr:glycine zipper family protein [Elusimicrobiota bacterium]
MKNRLLPLTAALLAACATAPRGPDVAVMPGPGKSFEQFQEDDRVCRDYAERALGPNADQAGANVAKSAAIGTAAGAAAGALLGMGHAHAIAGTAGFGLLLGSAIGASNAQAQEQSDQRHYDIAYEQCMTSKGNQLPESTTYYRYRHRHRPVVIYQSPPP